MGDFGTYGTLVSTVITLCAILVALFREEIRNWWHHPTLTAQIRLSPPDCHKYEVWVENPEAESPRHGNGYFFRMWIQNDGRLRAEKVQVFISRLQRQQADGRFRNVDTFLPMNLLWSHSTPESPPEVFAEGISPGMGKHCDFGCIVDPELRTLLQFPNPPDFNEKETLLGLHLEVGSSPLGQVPKGKYRFFFKISAANSRPVEKCWEVTLTGLWREDEQAMFSEGIGIIPLKIH